MGTPIRSKAINWGRNVDIGFYPDDHYVRCSRCGFVCCTDRDVMGQEDGREGWGTTMVATTSTTTGNGYPGSPLVNTGFQSGNYVKLNTWNSNIVYDSSSTWDAVANQVETRYDAVVGGGCAQCGTFLYNRD